MNRSAIVFGVDISPMSIARMVWKRKTIIICIWLVFSLLAGGIVLQLPAVYTASSLIILDSQKIPEQYVSATVNTDVQDRFAAISQHILSTPQLKKIIDQFNLYADVRKNGFPEDLIERLRREIRISPEKAVTGGRHGAFRISYEGPNPVVVAQVVNQIAQLFVEENLRTREEQAGGTSEFIDAQLSGAKKNLDLMEAAVSSYKVEHNGELPQQEASLNGILGRLQVELEANRDGMNRAQTTKVNLENSLSTAQESLAMLTLASQPAAVPGVSIASTSDLAVETPRVVKPSDTLRAQLQHLQARGYSDEHPDVTKARMLLQNAERLERQAESEIVHKAQSPRPASTRQSLPAAPSPGRDNAERASLRERISSLQSQLALVKQEIDTRRSEQKRILQDIGVHQSRIVRLPIREQEMSQITRDYDIAKLHYRSLLEKKISAEMAADMERRQKAERFTIADIARTPNRPTKPNRPLFVVIGSMAGLLLGCVAGLGYEFRKRFLLGPWQVPPEIPVIGLLPEIRGTDPSQSSHKRIDNGQKATAVMSFLVACVLSVI